MLTKVELRECAGAAWCGPNSDKVMDVDLANAFVEKVWAEQGKKLETLGKRLREEFGTRFTRELSEACSKIALGVLAESSHD